MALRLQYVPISYPFTIIQLTHLDVLTALCVLLAFKTLGRHNRERICLPELVDVDQTISQGMDILQEVGGQCHPLASRYLQAVQTLVSNLHILSMAKDRGTDSNFSPVNTVIDEQRESPEDQDSGSRSSPRPMDQPAIDGSMILFCEDFLEMENNLFSSNWEQ